MSLGLVPAPARAQVRDGEAVVLLDGSTLAFPAELAPAVRWWRRLAEESFGIDLVVAADDESVDVLLTLDPAVPAGGYRLTVGGTAADAAASDSTAADLAAADAAASDALVQVAVRDLAGAHAALQTLRQLAGPDAFRRAAGAAVGAERATLTLPACEIGDAPRLDWRGVLLDVARHFRTKAEVLRFIDLAAAHHLNVLQLHLTDDQGWRIEVDAFPRLVEVAAWRRATEMSVRRTGTTDLRPHGGYYTRADLREIAAYARERGIVVVPEIDVPGHSQAVITAYPYLGARQGADGYAVEREVWTTWGVTADVLDPSPQTLAFFKVVIDQVIEDMDPPYFHIGGDEVPTTAWRENPAIVQRALDLGYVTPDGSGDVARLHGWFLGELAAHLRDKGLRTVMWDEAFGPDLPKDVILTVWREASTALEAVAAGHDVVLAMLSHLYLDFPQSGSTDEPWHFGANTPLEKVYELEPVLPAVEPAEEGITPGRVLGVQAQLWSEHMDTVSSVDFSAFPRLAAVAEIAWTTGLPAERVAGSTASDEFVDRLKASHLPRLDAAGVAYRPLDGPLPWQRHPVAELPEPAAAARSADHEL